MWPCIVIIVCYSRIGVRLRLNRRKFKVAPSITADGDTYGDRDEVTYGASVAANDAEPPSSDSSDDQSAAAAPVATNVATTDAATTDANINRPPRSVTANQSPKDNTTATSNALKSKATSSHSADQATNVTAGKSIVDQPTNLADVGSAVNKPTKSTADKSAVIQPTKFPIETSSSNQPHSSRVQTKIVKGNSSGITAHQIDGSAGSKPTPPVINMQEILGSPKAKDRRSRNQNPRGTRTARTRTHVRGLTSARDQEVIKTLMTVFVVFLASYMPFAVAALADIHDTFSYVPHSIAAMMGISSSSMNVIVYGVTNRSFRRAYYHVFHKIFHCHCKK